MNAREVINTLEDLLHVGEIAVIDSPYLLAGRQLGLLMYSEDRKRIVATTKLVELLRSVPSDKEAVASIISLEPSVRLEWQRITVARLREMGQIRDVAGLCNGIDTINGAALSLLGGTIEACLESTPFAEMERALFEVSAEQAAASPKLFRALGATARFLMSDAELEKSLPNVDLVDPSMNWIKGRIILPPTSSVTSQSLSESGTTVLSGALNEVRIEELDPAIPRSQHVMGWILARPWAFFLAQIVFAQEAWAAERISGSIALELDLGHLSQFHRPPSVQVVVTMPQGEEILCGSLSGLVTRVLDSLGMSVFAPSLDDMDMWIGEAIESLLEHEVWRFEYTGGGRRPGYLIHPTFSDNCYRFPGSKLFVRLGSTVTGAIRRSCDQWARSHLAQVGKQVLTVERKNR